MVRHIKSRCGESSSFSYSSSFSSASFSSPSSCSSSSSSAPSHCSWNYSSDCGSCPGERMSLKMDVYETVVATFSISLTKLAAEPPTLDTIAAGGCIRTTAVLFFKRSVITVRQTVCLPILPFSLPVLYQSSRLKKASHGAFCF